MAPWQRVWMSPDVVLTVLDILYLFCFLNPRMTSACQKKCIAASYGEGDLSKGESVCLDRCVAKYLEVHDNLGKKLTEKSMQDQQLQQQQGAEKKS